MRAIPIYDITADDYSKNGRGLLLPNECIVHGGENSVAELTLVQPITSDMRWMLLQRGRVVKAAMPIRESPMYEIDAFEGIEDSTSSITRKLYVVDTNGSRLNLRQKPSTTNSPILGAYPEGTEIVRLADANDEWYKVSVRNGGAVGYMRNKWLRYVRDITETVTTSKPVTREGVTVAPARDQLFRIYSLSTDTERGTVTAKAQQLFGDQRGNVINAEYTPENVEASEAVKTMCDALVTQDHPYTIHVYASGTVTGDFSFRNIVEALLDPDDGVAAQIGACTVIDNYDIYLLPNEQRDMGVTIRRRKNLKSVVVDVDESSVVTRIIPIGKTSDGSNLYLDGVRWIDSPHISEYPVPHTKAMYYDVTSGSDEYPDDIAARAELVKRGEQEFENGADQPAYGMDVDFISLGNTPEYPNYASLQAVHLYDTVTVIDELVQIIAKLRMTEYDWDVLLERYDKTTLGKLLSARQTVYSYNIVGGISGSKISRGSVTGGQIATGGINSGNLSNSANVQLAANSLYVIAYAINAITAADVLEGENLAAAIDKASRVTAQISRTCVRAAHGGYYDLEVTAYGNITATAVSLTNAEINAGITDAGRVILNTTIPYGALTTSDIVSTTALLSRLLTARINVNDLFAREDFLTLLAEHT